MFDEFGNPIADGAGAGATPATPAATPHNPVPPTDELSDFWSDEPALQPQQQQQQQQQGTPQLAPAQQQQQQQPGNSVLDQAVAGLQLPPAMNDQIMQQMADGNIEGFNRSIAQIQQQAVRHTLLLTGQMLLSLKSGMMQEVQQLMQGQFNEKDNSTFLESKLPQVDAAVKPVVKALFTQALKKSKGNREKAVEMTKSMLGRMGIVAGGNGGGGNHGRGASDNNVNWADALGLVAPKQ